MAVPSEERQARLRREASNLARALCTSWGYIVPLLDRTESLTFYLDVDVTSPREDALVCRGMCVRTSEQACHYLSQPLPGCPVSLYGSRTPDTRCVARGMSELVVDLGFHGLYAPYSPDGTYGIPDLSCLMHTDADHQELYLEERLYRDGLVRELFLPEDHALYETRGPLHVYLLERWIGMLPLPTQVYYRAYPRPARVDVLTLEDAANASSLTHPYVCAFTTTPGAHCIFTLGTTYRQGSHFIDACVVADQRATFQELQSMRYHFFVSHAYPTEKVACDALLCLRRSALSLV
jgi:hypothetical protein